jgi:hypothetical protein
MTNASHEAPPPPPHEKRYLLRDVEAPGRVGGGAAADTHDVVLLLSQLPHLVLEVVLVVLQRPVDERCMCLCVYAFALARVCVHACVGMRGQAEDWAAGSCGKRLASCVNACAKGTDRVRAAATASIRCSRRPWE